MPELNIYVVIKDFYNYKKTKSTMKKVLFLTYLMLMSIGLHAQNETVTNQTVLDLLKEGFPLKRLSVLLTTAQLALLPLISILCAS